MREPPESVPPLFPMPPTASEATCRNRAGERVPSIPLPFYGLRKHCGCGRKFWTEEGYKGHYALAHILLLGG